MSQITLYDTRQGKKLPFKPLDPQLVKIYSCGPTVYDRQHIGNLRYAFYVDLLKVVLKEVGEYEVKHVMNITDVGHLTDDGDQGEDKMEKGSQKEGLTAAELAKKYEQVYLDDLDALRIQSFDVLPRATEHIDEQIAMVEQLEEVGLTYEIPDDGIYLDTSKIDNYAQLVSEKHLAGLQEGKRVAATGKRHPTDFALRKFSPQETQRQMERDSPRGTGFPGWHIECSAMSHAHLGPQIDIHTGGIEHIPVHHTNEIVQSEYSCCKHPRVQYRVHLQHLQLNGTKISKSLGNVIYLSDITDRGFAPEDLRYFFLSAHYRNFQDFTRGHLKAAKNTRANLIKKIAQHDLDDYTSGHKAGDLYTQLCEAISDDLDTVQVLALINKGVERDAHAVFDILLFDQEILRLGLFAGVEELAAKSSTPIPKTVRAMADQRLAAKQDQDFATADKLREQISAAGREVHDTADGYELTPRDS